MSRTVPLFASLAAALLLAVVVAAVATLEPAQAAFPGKNGKIAFSTGVIYVMNPNGSGVRPLIGATGHSPTWSADGTRIAFVSDGDIYSMNADGSNRTQLTNNSDQEYNPTWAPNGKKIAYEREVPVGSDQVLSKVYIMNANGSHQVPL